MTALAALASARSALREAIGPLHAAVEARFVDLDLAAVGDYGRFLLAHAEVIPALEAALDRAGIATELQDWAQRRRAAALAADLAALGLAFPAGSVVAVRSGAEAMGVAYVLEGSRLGAARLLKALPAALPRAFLAHGQGQHLFRSFLPHLEAVEDIPAAIAGARRAFGLFLTDGDA